MPRITLIVQVNTDPVPGMFHEPEDHKTAINAMLTGMYPWYKPSVKLLDATNFESLRRTISDLIQETENSIRYHDESGMAALADHMRQEVTDLRVLAGLIPSDTPAS